MAGASRADVLPVRGETDVVLVRQTVRTWSVQQGFTLVDQTKMVTAASEIARNTVNYGGGGTVRIEAAIRRASPTWESSSIAMRCCGLISTSSASPSFPGPGSIRWRIR